MRHTAWIGVALGGFAGALARYELSQLAVTWHSIPVNILIINLLGAFLLGLFLEVSLERLRLPVPLRAGISTGFLGAFTTFSGLCAEAFELAGRTGAGMAGLYLAFSVGGGIAAAFTGIAAARRMMDRTGEFHE